MDEVQYVTSIRGKPQLAYNGFKHVFKRTNKNGTKFWVCVNSFKSLSCSGTITINSKNEIIKFREHDCTPDVALIEVQQCTSICKKRAREELTPIPKIFEDEFAGAINRGLDFVTTMPVFSTVKSSLYRIRNNAYGLSNQAKPVTEIVIPDALRKTATGKDFILFDEMYGLQRIIGMGSETGFDSIKYSDSIFGDGTFKACPVLFNQLYSFHAETNTAAGIRPSIYVLTTSKNRTTYSKVLSNLSSVISTWKPKKMMIDFETSVIQAVREAFPDCELKGCNFHFNQCLWRKVQALGMTSLYSSNSEVKHHIRMIAALAFLPSAYTEEGWLKIMENSPQEEKVTEFNDYFIEQWLENDIVQDMWICHGEKHRTNNTVEGWHNRLNRRIGKNHPNVLELIKVLREDSEHYDTLQTKAEMFGVPKKRRKQYEDLDRKINFALAKFLDNQDVEKILKYLGYLIKLE